MTWKLAAAAVTLRDQVNKRYPRRDRASDGTIGDQAHRRRISDHNPDKSGYVMALDLDEDGWPAHKFADQLIEYVRTSGDKRIRNVVYEGRVASGTYSNKLWVWRKAPSLGHKHHIHISFAEPAKRDGSPFPLPVLEGAPLVPAKKAPDSTGWNATRTNTCATIWKESDARQAQPRGKAPDAAPHRRRNRMGKHRTPHETRPARGIAARCHHYRSACLAHPHHPAVRHRHAQTP
jgi:hypothetical protein